MPPKNKIDKKKSFVFPEQWAPLGQDSKPFNKNNHVMVSRDRSDLPAHSVESESDNENIIDAFIAREEVSAIHAKRVSALRRFVQAFSEVAPLVNIISREIDSDLGVDFKRRVSILFNDQLTIVNMIKDHLLLDESQNDDKILVSVIAKQVSDLIGCGLLTTGDSELVDSLLVSLEGFIAEREYLGDVIYASPDSTDILVNVKIALFPSALKFHKLISRITSNSNEIDRWIKWHHDITVNLAKDLAFNWDKSATFRDRESLFEKSLSHCSTIVEDVFKGELTYSLFNGEPLSSRSKDVFLANLNDLESAINECDMGYSKGSDFDSDYVKNRLFEFFIEKSESLSNFHLYGLDPDLIKCYVGRQVALQSSLSWIETTRNILDVVERLSDEEYELWRKNEGLKRMNLDSFLSASYSNGMSSFERIIQFDESSLLLKCKSRLAVLWGLSDAVCRIKKRD